MYIIFGDNAAEALRQSYTVLELEEFDHEGQKARAYCVVPGEKINILELPLLDGYKKLHSEFVRNYEAGNYDFCVQAVEHLMGKFGGELDTFYQELVKKIPPV